MRVLVTSSRMPHALDEVRKLGRAGHEVYAADTFRTSPGSHSRWVREWFLTPSPAFEPERYVSSVDAIVRTRAIDVVLPQFEEVFPLARHTERFPAVFCAPFDVLARLHGKHSLVELARALGVRVPETRVATSVESLALAAFELGEYLARPAFSRGAIEVLTNAGPRAGARALEACRPTPERPWIVQRFVHGEEVCSFSVARRGRVAAHGAYVHPKRIDGGGGILFESVDEPESLDVARRFAEHLGYDGQISFDFLRDDRGLVLLECNPRPTAGVTMMSDDAFARALFGPHDDATHVVAAGVRKQIASAIVRDMLHDWRRVPSDLRALFSGAGDVYATVDDPAPGFWQVLSYSLVFSYRRRMRRARRDRSDLVAAQFHDVAWDGGELP